VLLQPSAPSRISGVLHVGKVCAAVSCQFLVGARARFVVQEFKLSLLPIERERFGGYFPTEMLALNCVWPAVDMPTLVIEGFHISNK
jgi:hypothetical protein